MKQKIPIAIAYDFDGTLAPGNMQEHSFIPELGISKEAFWHKSREGYACKKDMDEILAYMYLLMSMTEAKGGITRALLARHGNALNFFPGVEAWFGRINAFSEDLGIDLKHYIISSGLREMIEASRISGAFAYIWASGFMYDASGKAIWPALAINYTTKTQYLFRINKGVLNSYENDQINCFTPDHKRAVPFRNMIYLGDGDTDVPSMKMMMHQGGKSIAVYDSAQRATKQAACKRLQLQSRVNYYTEADYTDGSELDLIIKDILQHTAESY